jgi:hypothetical protein
MLRTVSACLFATAVLAWCGGRQPVQAQNPQPAPPTAQPAPVGPPNSASPPPEKIEPSQQPRSTTRPGTRGQDTLGGGTLRPPDVDPGMAVRPPANAQGTMPVVPPPGSPGGNQNVLPK